jgi:hypothetical protein
MSKIVFSVFLSLALIGCTMNNISGHDADIEKGLTEVGKKADTLFVSLENTANTPSDCSYEKNKKSYGIHLNR